MHPERQVDMPRGTDFKRGILTLSKRGICLYPENPVAMDQGPTGPQNEKYGHPKDLRPKQKALKKRPKLRYRYGLNKHD